MSGDSVSVRLSFAFVIVNEQYGVFAHGKSPGGAALVITAHFRISAPFYSVGHKAEQGCTPQNGVMGSLPA
jgi:hypothetical protein